MQYENGTIKSLPNTTKTKSCRKCDMIMTGFGRICQKCQVKQSRERAKQQKILKSQRLVLKKLKKKEKRENSYKKISKLAWQAFSKFVRQSVADFQGYTECYTCCVLMPWPQLQAGHFNHRGHRRYQLIDFELKHIKPQCAPCNMYGVGNGEQYKFGKRLAEQYGEGWPLEIDLRRDTEPALSVEELKEVISRYS